MKQILMSLLSAILFLTACGQTLPVRPTPPASVVHEATPTSSPISTTTSTFIPTETPTASITPLPTIPTFTPTFDASTMVTVTPAPKAECPENDNSIKLNFKFDNKTRGIELKILNFLNEGGSIQTIVTALAKTNNSYKLADITNDGNPDLILGGFLMLDANDLPITYDTFYILSCRNGQYSLFSGEQTIGTALFNTIYEITDMNINGIPEVIIYNNKALNWNQGAMRIASKECSKALPRRRTL